MGRRVFKVLAGKHSINSDVSVPQGQTLESDDDLVAIHGSNKFQDLGPAPAPAPAPAPEPKQVPAQEQAQVQDQEQKGNRNNGPKTT